MAMNKYGTTANNNARNAVVEDDEALCKNAEVKEEDKKEEKE